MIFINIAFTIFMCALAAWDHISFIKTQHRDFKSIIMSTGVLGTFVGIFIGLQDFDVTSIENSVPTLLEGLKTAFYTSILGMGLAILLAILQKRKIVKSDFDHMLDYFSLQAGKLDTLQKLDKLESLMLLGEIKEQNRSLIDLQVKSQEKDDERFKILEGGFGAINDSLKEAMHHLAQGASKELINALQEVIKDFNLRITDQFGDNFKELNNAVTQMISWQDGYRDSISALDKNLKQTLELFNATKDSLELVASRNSEVLAVYEALGQSIEASRNESEKLANLLERFGSLHENASNALLKVENLSQALEQTHDKSMQYSKSTLESIEEVLSSGAKNLQENMQNSLDENLKQLSLYANAQSESLKALQGSFNDFNNEYLTQNKEHLQNTLESLKSELSTLLNEVVENDSALKHKNLEMISHIENSIKERLDSAKEGFNEHLDMLENAQKESLLLIEEQAKRSDDVLMRHSQNMESTLEKASLNLQNLSEKTKENLEKNSNTLEQHITNAVVNFDTLLGNTTKTLEENLKDSKDTIKTLSKELENSMIDTAKSLDTLLNDSANHLSKSTQNIEESIIHTSNTLSENFRQTTQNITETLENCNKETTKSFAEHLDSIKNTIETNSSNISQNFQELSQNLGNSVKSLLEQNEQSTQGLQKLLEQSVSSFYKALEQMHKTSNDFSQNLQGQLRSNFAESYKNALDSLSAFLKNTTNSYQKGLVELSQSTMESQKQMQESLKGHLSGIARGFESNSKAVLNALESFSNELIANTNNKLESHTQGIMSQYGALEDNIKNTLEQMAKNYLSMLEVLTKQSLESPKNVSIELLNTFNKLQSNLGDALSQTYLSLENNRKEIDGILKITQTSIATSLKESANLNNNLCRSLGELDGALSNITLGFRQDYEWFLRRIRELMGARS